MTGTGGRRRGKLIANAAIILLGGLLLYASTGVSLSLTIGRNLPAIASIWPSPAAAAAASERRLTQPNPDLRASYDEALAVWRREPLSIGALRVVAAAGAAVGQANQTEPRFRYIEQLSRRDLSTQVWLIEAAVRRNDVPDALRHYDRAMRTSIRIRPTLFPILAQAAAGDQTIRQGIGSLLAARPNYGFDLFNALMRADGAASILPDLVRTSGLRLDNGSDAALIQGSISRLIELQHFDEAFAMHAAYRPARRTALLSDPGFEAQPALVPFDWQVGPDVEISASGEGRGQRSDGSVNYRAPDDGRHMIVQQMLRLPAGGYQLSFRFSPDAASPPRVTLACARTSFAATHPASVLTLRRDGDRATAPFAAEAGCGYYLIEFSTESAGSGWIDDVAVVAQAAGAASRQEQAGR